MHKVLGDFTSLGLGYGLATPSPDGLVHNLLTALPVSQSVVDEIVKALAGLLLAVISRWLYARVLDKPTLKNKSGDMPENTEQLPDEIVLSNLKNKEDGNEKTQISK